MMMTARDHFAEGERLLDESRQRPAGSPASDTYARQASAHFAAARVLLAVAEGEVVYGVRAWPE